MMTQTTNTERLAFTEGAAAEASGLPRQTICAARKAGELKATKSGRRWIILRQDLDAWLQRCRDRGVFPNLIDQKGKERLAELNRARRTEPV